jgi:NAD(P)-dependent dehydrogenase (short-subunit alcohol dehydrogenase family)
MSTIDASTLLRPELLQGVSVLLAGASSGGSDDSFGASVGAACVALGARVCELALSPDAIAGREDGEVERAAHHAVEQALADAGAIELLVIDGASVFTRASELGRDGNGAAGAARDALLACLDVSWNVTRSVAERAFLPEARGGRIVYLAPPTDAGEHARAAGAGLENLARTLSIEWARHDVTSVAIAPGAAGAAGTAEAEVAALTAYLASPAGAYFSGCLLDLSGA